MTQAPQDNELDSLLAESVEGLDPLDALLAESMETVKQNKEAKLARERLKRGGQSAAQIAEDAERIRQWELAHEWTIVANVAFWERHECDGCGHHQTIFRQFMHRQVHNRMAKTERWVEADKMSAEHPSETLVQKWSTPMCPRCCEQQGFPFRNVQEMKG